MCCNSYHSNSPLESLLIDCTDDCTDIIMHFVVISYVKVQLTQLTCGNLAICTTVLSPHMMLHFGGFHKETQPTLMSHESYFTPVHTVFSTSLDQVVKSFVPDCSSTE